jgi:hypothetical protein
MPQIISSGASASDEQLWSNLQDGRIDDSLPLQVGYTCKVTKNWKTPQNMLFKVGMASKVISIN